jgi:hypothetical protein
MEMNFGWIMPEMPGPMQNGAGGEYPLGEPAGSLITKRPPGRFADTAE